MDCASKNNEKLASTTLYRCFVVGCSTNSKDNTDKRFFNVPFEPQMRQQWMEAAGRHNDKSSPKSRFRCCEIHFDMENDFENLLWHKLVGGNLRLKKGVIPHIFFKNQTTRPNLKRRRVEVPDAGPNADGVRAILGAAAAVGAGARAQDGVPGDARAVPGVRDRAAGPHAHLARAAGVAEPRDGVAASAAAGRAHEPLAPQAPPEEDNEDQQKNPLADCPASIKEELPDSFELSPSIQCIDNEDQQENTRPLEDCPASIKEELPDSFESSPSIQCIEAIEDDTTASYADYQCDQCRADVVGFRYCCVQCTNYELCGACEAVGHHATHYMLRVPPTKPHVEVQAVLENIRNVLFQKEDENSCELEAEVKVEAPEPAPEPDPLAPPSGPQFQDQETPTINESTFAPSDKRDDLYFEHTVVKLEVTDEESQETSHSRLVPVVTQPTMPAKRKTGLCDVRVYSGGGGGGVSVYTRIADPPRESNPEPDPTPRLVPQYSQGVDARKECLNKGMLCTTVQAVKKVVPSTAKRKTKAPLILLAKVKKSDLI